MLHFNEEVEYGNVEYKRKLTNDNKRILSLTTQLIWRLNEGNGHAIYMLGLNDDGSPYTLSSEEYDTSIIALNKMCLNSNAKIITINDIIYKNCIIYKILIATNNYVKQECRILLLGQSNLQYLAHMIYNDMNMAPKIYKYEHEHNTGISSLTIGYIGYDKYGNLNNNINCTNLYEIKEKSSTLITLYILPGCKTYQNIVKHITHVLLCDKNIDQDLYKLSQKYKIPCSIASENLNNITTSNAINSINGLTIISILTNNNDTWLLLVLNNNCTIEKNNIFYSFNNVYASIPIITIVDIRYCDRYINQVNENITFTIIVKSNTDLKKYKRETFFKI